MIIPHIAIVSSLLLGCNNPNICESLTCPPDPGLDRVISMDGAVSRIADERTTNTTAGFHKKLQFHLSKVYTPLAHSRYKAAWIWNRGKSKARWIMRISQEYANLSATRTIRDEVLFCRQPSKLVAFTIMPASVLVYIPAFLGASIR